VSEPLIVQAWRKNPADVVFGGVFLILWLVVVWNRMRRK
jgi:hypothetical protein